MATEEMRYECNLCLLETGKMQIKHQQEDRYYVSLLKQQLSEQQHMAGKAVGNWAFSKTASGIEDKDLRGKLATILLRTHLR